MVTGSCPNLPPCEHPGMVHEWSGDYEDPRYMCCVDECPCGKPAPAEDAPADDARADFERHLGMSVEDYLSTFDAGAEGRAATEAGVGFARQAREMAARYGLSG